MVNWQLLLAGAIGIVPAFGLLVLAYGRYDGKFRDETMFLLFMTGLFLGFPVSLLEAYLFIPIVFVFGFPVLEQLLKTVIANLPRYQRQPTIRFYAGSLGLGIGSILVFAQGVLVFGRANKYVDIVDVAADPLLAATFATAGVAILAVHLATGILIGEGVAQGRPFRFSGWAIAAAIPIQAMAFEFLAGLRDPSGAAIVPLWPALMAVYSIVVLRYVLRNVLPNALPPGERRRVKKAFFART